MNPVVGGALVTGFANLFGSAQANQSNLDAIREYNKAQYELAKYQNEYNLDMWNRQNEYNLPVNQMNRIKAAGLNPNLVYGTGNVVGNTTSNAPQAVTPNLKPVTGKKNVIGPAVESSWHSYLQGAQVDQQLRIGAAQEDLLREQKNTEVSKQENLRSNSNRLDFLSLYDDDLREYRKQNLHQDVLSKWWHNEREQNWFLHRRESENYNLELQNNKLSNEIDLLSAKIGLTYAQTSEVFALINKMGYEIDYLKSRTNLTDEQIIGQVISNGIDSLEFSILSDVQDARVIKQFIGLIGDAVGIGADVFKIYKMFRGKGVGTAGKAASTLIP